MFKKVDKTAATDRTVEKVEKVETAPDATGAETPADTGAGTGAEGTTTERVSADESEAEPGSVADPGTEPAPEGTPVPAASTSSAPSTTTTSTPTSTETSADGASGTRKSKESKKMPSVSTNDIRTKVAQVVWLLCAFFALVLAAGALLIALQGSGANPDNSLFQWVDNTAGNLDFGVFSREGGLFDFTGKGHETKNALVNWGIAAIVWLVIGRLADRIIRP